uniref:TPR_REGION domain-containing protein n=1 Tax=Macrostomum lignano TaxID=282301 RepID=A0A1I8F778_9PLAT
CGAKPPVQDCRQLHNTRPLDFIQQGPERDGWYRRIENNGWRLVSDRALAGGKTIDPDPASGAAEFHHDRLQRRADLAAKRKQRRVQWLMKMHREGLLKSREPEAADLVESAADGMVRALEAGDEVKPKYAAESSVSERHLNTADSRPRPVAPANPAAVDLPDKTVRTLEQEAFTLLEAGQSQEALIRLSDALEIDAGNSRLLCLRAQLYCQLGDFETALSDAEQAASVEQFSCETCCFRSAILRKLERNDEAILHNIRCLSLDDCNLPRVKTSLLLSFRRMLPHTAEQLDAMRDLEIFNFLCQIGVLASKEGRQHLAIQLKYSEVAIELYTECLKVATEVHDSSYQIKCLVSLATMHLHSDNVAKATAYYQRLLDLRQDKAVINGDDWSPELECGLLLNLSICCATLGNLDESKRYAELSVSRLSSRWQLLKCRPSADRISAWLCSEPASLSWPNLGDPSLLASCQGLLGSVMAELRNAGLSAAYHEQQIINSRRCDDRDALARAHLASGDSLRLLGKFDSAVDSFAEAGRAAIRPEMKLLAEVKIGETHLSADRPQRALYHFERCLEIAEADSAVSSDQLQSVQLQVAVIHQMSSSPEALDIAERLFYQLLPNLERGLDRPRPWDAPAPRDLLRDLRRCYLGLANSAAKRGKFERALLASEAARQRSLSHHLAGRQSLLSSDRFDGLGGGGGGGVVANR